MNPLFFYLPSSGFSGTSVLGMDARRGSIYTYTYTYIYIIYTYIYICVCMYICTNAFETRSHYKTLAELKLAMQTRWTLNSQSSFCLCLLSAKTMVSATMPSLNILSFETKSIWPGWSGTSYRHWYSRHEPPPLLVPKCHLCLFWWSDSLLGAPERCFYLVSSLFYNFPLGSFLGAADSGVILHSCRHQHLAQMLGPVCCLSQADALGWA